MKPKDSKVEQFFCKYHNKKCSVEDQVPSYNACRESKRSYDSLQKLANKQGEMEWFKDLVTEPKELAKAIYKYRKLCPSGGGRGTKGARLNLARSKSQS